MCHQVGSQRLQKPVLRRQKFRGFEHAIPHTEHNKIQWWRQRRKVFGNLVHACKFKIMKTVVPYTSSSVACVTNTEFCQTIFSKCNFFPPQH